MDELIDDPHLTSKGFFVDVKHPSEGHLKVPGIAAQFSKTRAEMGRPAPRLGEQSREILKVAGYSELAIKRLLDAGVTAEPR